MEKYSRCTLCESQFTRETHLMNRPYISFVLLIVFYGSGTFQGAQGNRHIEEALDSFRFYIIHQSLIRGNQNIRNVNRHVLISFDWPFYFPANILWFHRTT